MKRFISRKRKPEGELEFQPGDIKVSIFGRVRLRIAYRDNSDIPEVSVSEVEQPKVNTYVYAYNKWNSITKSSAVYK